MSTELPKPLQTAMRAAGFLDPRAGNPSLNQWSNESGVHTSTISRFIAGGTTRQDNVRKMADALGVSIPDLYAMTERTEEAPWSPPSGTERLTVRQRKALNELILSFVEEKAGEDDASTPLTQAGVSPADDGLGAFGHRDRGDHEAFNDGSGGNVRQLHDWRDWAADASGETEKQRLDREAAEIGEENQDPGGDE